MKNKCTFEEFLKKVYDMTMLEYLGLNTEQQKAAELDYIIRYGAPIRWF